MRWAVLAVLAAAVVTVAVLVVSDPLAAWWSLRVFTP